MLVVSMCVRMLLLLLNAAGCRESFDASSNESRGLEECLGKSLLFGEISRNISGIA